MVDVKTNGIQHRFRFPALGRRHHHHFFNSGSETAFMMPFKYSALLVSHCPGSAEASLESCLSESAYSLIVISGGVWKTENACAMTSDSASDSGFAAEFVEQIFDGILQLCCADSRIIL